MSLCVFSRSQLETSTTKNINHRTNKTETIQNKLIKSTTNILTLYKTHVKSNVAVITFINNMQ